MFDTEMAAGARKVVEICAGVKPGENVLVLTDTDRPFSISKALSVAATAAGAKVAVLIAPPRSLPGEEPDKIAASAMEGSDVVLAVTTQTVAHTEALHKALQKGARVLAMTECTEQTLMRGPIEADFVLLSKVVEALEEKFNTARLASVSAPGGTDIRLDLTGRIASTCPGICHEPGKMIGIPDVEVYIAPIEDRTEGVIVIDGSCSQIGLIEEPVTIEVERGKVKALRGGKEARQIEAILASSKDNSVYVVAEFAVGLNPKAKLVGKIIEDEGTYGTGHFALGNNTGFGGMNRSSLHLDLVYRNPTILFDGEPLMVKGELLGPLGECLREREGEENRRR